MRQQLSFLEVLAVAIGTIIGTGIFFIPGLVALMVGHGSIFLWAGAVIISILMGLCFADLASMFKQSGGPIVFVKEAFGDFFGFIAGWLSWLISAITIGGTAVALSYYISFIIPIDFIGRVVLSIFLLTIFTLINYHGIKLGARVEIGLTFLTVFLLLMFIGWGSSNFKMESFGDFPITLAMFGPALVFALELFIGWETTTIIAEEVKNARKNIPRALLFTVLIVGGLYFFTLLIFLGNVSIADLVGSLNPLGTAAANFGGTMGKYVFGIGAVVIGMAALNSWILTTSRLPYAMSKQKIFLRWFDHLNPHDTPDRGLLIQFLFASAIAMFGSYEGALSLLMFSALAMYFLCYAALFKMRKRKRSFKLPWIIPVITILISLVAITQVDPWIILSGSILIILGIPSYVTIKLTTDKKFIEKFFDRLAFFFNFYVPTILYRSSERDNVIEKSQLLKGQTVLDYGCCTGSTTERIAKEVYPGKVVAMDISRKQLAITLEKVKEKIEVPNVIFVRLTKGMPFKKGSFDRIVSTIAVNYFVHPENELKSLSKILKKDGVVVFLAINAPPLPLHPFLKTDSSIKAVFERAGFKDVRIERTSKLIRKYIYITAKK